jgi:hypothetical protein
MELREELQRVDWSRFETAYGVATDVPRQLTRLFSTDFDDAMQASHDLWCGLCHQHAYVSSASVPALPFLLRFLDIANDELAIEVLDILCGLAVFTAREALPDWQKGLRRSLLAETSRFKALTCHQNEEVSAWARRICENLSSNSTC